MQCSHCRIDIVMIVGDGIDHVVGCGRDGLVSTRRATHTGYCRWSDDLQGRCRANTRHEWNK